MGTMRPESVFPGAAVAIAALSLCAPLVPVQASDRNERAIIEAFENILDREPDAGSQGYVSKVLQQGWSEQDVARELRKSDEYRSRNQ